MKERRSKFPKPQWLVLIAPFILIGPTLLTGKAIYWGTPLLQFVPWWTQAWRTLRLGELPLWNPLNGMGAPLLANYQSALLYPPTWLYFIFAEIGGSTAIAWGQALLVALHIAWAGWGMVSLTKKLGWSSLAQTVSALAFSLSGYLLARSHFLSINASLAWLPWLMLGVYQLVQNNNKKSILILTVLIAMQLLAGHAQITWYSLQLAAVWLTFLAWQKSGWNGIGRAWLSYVLASGWAVALTAIQLFPTAEYLIQSQRATAYSFSQAMTYSFWPWRWLTLLFPNLYGSPASGDYWAFGAYWEDAIYIGLLPIILALAFLIKKNKNPQQKNLVKFLSFVITISFIFALGENTPIFPWVYKNLPTFDMFQAPTRFTIWAVFALALLAGLGAMHWRKPKGRALYWSNLAIMAAFAITLTASLLSVFEINSSLGFENIKPSYLTSFLIAGIFALGISILNLFAPVKSGAKPNPAWIWAVTIFLTIDLLLASWAINPGVDAALYQDNAAVVENENYQNARFHLSLADEKNLKFGRFLNFKSYEVNGGIGELRNAFLPNTNLLDQISISANFDPLLPERYTTWMAAIDQASPEAKSEMLARMGIDIEILVSESPTYEVSFHETQFNYGELRWASCGFRVQDAETALEMILNGNLNGPENVLLETEDELICGQTVDPAFSWTRSANKMAVELQTNTAGYLVLADTWYPGWKAYIDGEETEIYRADHLFRAILVPPGSHEIQFIYLPASFYSGATISIFALGVWIYFYRKDEENL